MLCSSTRSRHSLALCRTLSSDPLRAVVPASIGAAQFKTAAGKCPRNGTPVLRTGPAKGTLSVPKPARGEYKNLIGGTQIKLPFTNIKQGGSYCAKKGSKKITIGGTLLFKSADGKCVTPPVKKDGSACCKMQAWQPNAGGYYYDNCSMSCAPL
jgi:hypothetical protein